MSFEPPADWRRITTIDAHTAGEPLRVVCDGLPPIPGETILEKRRYAREHLDSVRRALMLEPRGHADMYGCYLTEPVTPDGDVGVLFLHNEGYSTMCGHGIIGLVKVGLESGRLRGDGDRPVIRIDTPAGRVTATAELVEGRVKAVSFRNVPSFLLERDLEIDVPGLGSLRCDIAFGGAFYAYVNAADLELEVDPKHHARIVDVGRRIKRAVSEQYRIVHPDGQADLEFLYGTILVDPPIDRRRRRNVCVFADGEVDRSPTGTGVSGLAAIAWARGEIGSGEPLTVESLIGTSFVVEVVEEASAASLPAIVPEVTGSAYITGRHEFFLYPEDPLVEGVLLR